MAIHGRVREHVLTALPVLKPFRAGGKAYGDEYNFRGTPVPVRTVLPQTGQLSDAMKDRFHNDFIDGIDYVVWSYGTPIAWHLNRTDEWVQVPQKFSVSTTNHQSMVAWALAR